MNHSALKKIILGNVVAACCMACPAAGQHIDLAGDWSVQLQQSDKQEMWENSKEGSKIKLPGSLQAQGLGNDISEKTRWLGALKNASWLPYYGKQKDGSFKVAGWLQPEKHYLGAAWYRRQVTIPESWSGKQALLKFERVHISTVVWWDDVEIGTENSLSTPHQFLLTNLKPGTHTLTVRVNNHPPADVGDNAHCVTDHTQTAWNGIIGVMQLQMVPDRWIDSISVFPDVAGKRVRIRAYFDGKDAGTGLKVKFEFTPPKGADAVPAVTVDCGAENTVETTVHLGDSIALWDEFSPNLYGLTASLLNNGAVVQKQTTTFGMVDYKVKDQQFMVNGRPTMMRGTLDCAAFPLTGYPSMDLEYWKRVFTVVKAHGFNHVRYHSWFPPEVAFQAANEIGVYLQCEHAWTGLKDKGIGDYLHRETERVLRRYGNHPSFAMHAYGNEPGRGSNGWLKGWVSNSKKLDEGRRLYTSAAGWGNTSNSDFYAVMKGMRVYPYGAGLESVINKHEPSFLDDYRSTTEQAKQVSWVNHEGGQWCVYPNFDEMKKYTGFLKPRNYEIFQANLIDNHMGELAKDFLMASGRLQTICYKYCIEKLLRTPGCGGYQMLGLNDFPGQGTALVGAVDVFWDTKPYTSAEEYRQFSGMTVPLARFPKVVFSKSDKPLVTLEIAHYGKATLENSTTRWTITTASGEVVDTGVVKQGSIPLGLSTLAEKHPINLATLKAPAQYRFIVSVDDTAVKNQWDFWVYPDDTTSEAQKVKITRSKAEALQLASTGATVLFVPTPEVIQTPKDRKPVFGFSPVFWNTVWSGRQPPTTLGILCDPKHPIFKEFPTEYHTNYQWWYLIKNAPQQPLFMNGQDPAFRPVVRVIDDWFTNYRLGLVVEAKVGKGKLLISAIDISEPRPGQMVLNQFRKSVLAYMNSADFDPKHELTETQLAMMIKDASPAPTTNNGP
jgi:hypothetical protein